MKKIEFRFIIKGVVDSTLVIKLDLGGFSIPRSADQERVFEIMIEAIKYCQKRLGGVLLDKDGNSFDKDRYKHVIQQTISRMDAQGIELGQGVTLRLF